MCNRMLKCNITVCVFTLLYSKEFSGMRIHVGVFWVVVPYYLVAGYQHTAYILRVNLEIRQYVDPKHWFFIFMALMVEWLVNMGQMVD
jgi:hypothetical protein